MNPVPTILFWYRRSRHNGTGKPVPYKGAAKKLSTALMYGEATAVSPATSTPGYQRYMYR